MKFKDEVALNYIVEPKCAPKFRTRVNVTWFKTWTVTPLTVDLSRKDHFMYKWLSVSMNCIVSVFILSFTFFRHIFFPDLSPCEFFPSVLFNAWGGNKKIQQKKYNLQCNKLKNVYIDENPYLLSSCKESFARPEPLSLFLSLLVNLWVFTGSC